MRAEVASSIFSLTGREVVSSGGIAVVTPQGHGDDDRIIVRGQPIYVRGWAVDATAGALASRVVLVVDGVLEFPTNYGHSRPDIATFLGVTEYAQSGFDAILPPVLDVGHHSIAACAVSPDGNSYLTVAVAGFYVLTSLVPRPFNQLPVEHGAGAIESFASDGDLRTSRERAGRNELAFGRGVTVHGWAYDARHRKPYAEIGVVVDDLWYLAGTSTQAPAGAYQCRFVLNFALPGDHTIYAVARRNARAPFVRVSEPMTFESIEPPLPWIWALIELRQPSRAMIDEIVVLGATCEAPLTFPQGNGIFIRGTAVDEPAGGPAGGVYFSFDGDRYQGVAARYGRPESPEAFTALLPTAKLSPGRHTIELRVVSRSWIGYYVPLAPIVVEIVPAGSDEDEDVH